MLLFFASALRSSTPPVKLYKHRVDVTEGSGSSYGELPADIAMSYKPIAPAPTGSNHTPPGFNTTQLLILDTQSLVSYFISLLDETFYPVVMANDSGHQLNYRQK